MNDKNLLKMQNYFTKRTKKHISLVQKYAKMLLKLDLLNDEDKQKMKDNVNKHDASKYKAPEHMPYVYITWNYKCKDEGIDFDMSSMKDKMSDATMHHIKHNPHHPEYWMDGVVRLNQEDRDNPSSKISDATKMPLFAVAEMVCDWMGMSEEKGTDPYDWAKKNVNVRWKFNGKQESLIYEILNRVWGEK
jgi:hypothetical protein